MSSMGARRRILAITLIGLLLAAGAEAQDPSPFGRNTLGLIAVGGQNYAPGRHGFAELVTPAIDRGWFVSRRLEVGVDFHPWIGIREPINDNGDGGYKSVSAFALDLYGRWYPARFSSIWRPYVELAAGPFYATRRVPTAGSRANFLVQVGTGIAYPIKALEPWSAVLGLRAVHISNADTYRRNPSWNFWGLVVGLRKFVGSAPGTR